MGSRFVLPLADVGSGIKPSSGAQLFFFENKQSIEKDTYTGPNELVDPANANPVTADENGVFPDIFIIGSYRVTLKDKNGKQIWSVDDVEAFGAGFTTTIKKFKPVTAGGQTVITVPDAPATVNVIISSAFQQESNREYTYVPGTITLTGPLADEDVVEVQYGFIASVAPPVDIQGLADFATVAQAQANLDLEVGDRFVCYGFNVPVTTFWEVIQAGVGAGDLTDGTLDLPGSGLQARLQIQPVMTPKHFGALGNGIADDTLEVNNCYTNSPNTVIDAPYLVTTVTAPNHFTCTGSGKFIANGAQDSRVCIITSRTVGRVVVDGNAKDVNCIYFPPGLGYEQHYESLDYSNVTVIVSSGNTNTGVTMFGDEVTGGPITGRDMINNGHPNDSFPQGLVTGAGTYNVESHFLQDGRSGYVSTAGGNVYLGENRGLRQLDNGAYLLGGDAHIGTHYYEDQEEPLVCSGAGRVVVDNLVCKGRVTSCLRYENTDSIQIGQITGVPSVDFDDPNFAASVPTAIISVRSGNVASGNIQIGSVEGFFQLGTLTDRGTTEKIDIKSYDITLCYKPSLAPLNIWPLNPTSANFWDWLGCQQMSRSHGVIRIKNFEAAPWPAGIMSVRHPTFTQWSTIKDEVIHILENDDTIAGPTIEYRGGKPQQFLGYDDVHWDITGGSLNMREAQEALFQKNATEAPPPDGYFYVGQILWDRSAGANILYVCSVEGDPATFVTK